MTKKDVVIVVLCVVIAVLIVGSWAIRQITLRDNTIAILNYHLQQMQQAQAPQPSIVMEPVEEPKKKK